MYEVYVNGELFGSSDAGDILNPEVKVELNKAGTFQCSILPGHKFYNRLIKMTSFVEVFLNKDRIFSGRLLNTDTDSYGQMSLYFEGGLSYLIDSVQDPVIVEESVRDHFIRGIEIHNSQVDPEKQFLPGIVDVEKADDIFLFEDLNYQDTQSYLNGLLSEYGGYLVVRNFGGLTYLDYLGERITRSPQDLQFGVNILDIQNYVSGENLYTVLLPIGPSVDDVIMTVESANDGSRFVEIEEMVKIFGRIVKVQGFDEAQSPEDLLNMANQYISDTYPVLDDSLSVRALDIRYRDMETRAIRVGDSVEIEYSPLGIKKLMTCTSIDYDFQSPENTSYEFGTVKPDLSQKYTSTVASLQSSITKHTTIINKMGEDILINARDIEVNARNIEINAQDILINARDIETNARNITINAEKIEANANDILLNAERIQANADQIEINAKNIDINAEEIRLRAYKQYVDEIEGRVTTAEAEIKINAGEIALRAYTTVVEALNDDFQNTKEEVLTRLQTAEVRIGNAEINMNTLSANLYGEINRIDASYESLSELVDEIGESVSEAYIRIDANKAEIELRARTTYVDESIGKVRSDVAIELSAIEGTIKLKADREWAEGQFSDIRSNVSIELNSVKSSITLKADRTWVENQIKDVESHVSLELDALNSKITAKADKTTVTDLEKRVTSAELDIDGAEAAIKLKADATVVTALSTRVTSAEATIDGLNASIKLKADATTVTSLTTRVTSAEANIDGLNASIKLKADASTVTSLTTRVTSAEANIDGLNASIKLKADSKTVDDLGTRIGKAELSIDGMNSTITLYTTKTDNMSKSLSSVSSRVTTAESEIKVLAGQIELKASTTTVDNLTKTVNTVKADFDSAKSTITFHAQSISTLDTRTTNMSEQISAAWISINGMDSRIEANAKEITLKADKITLKGYVTMDEFEAKTASIDNLFAGVAKATGIWATHMQCDTITIGGKTGSWKERKLVTSINSPTFNYVTLQYKDHSGTNKSQVVLTSVNTAASSNTSTYTLYEF